MKKQIPIAIALSCIWLTGCTNEDAPTDNKAEKNHEESEQPDGTENTPQDEQQPVAKEDSNPPDENSSEPEPNDTEDVSVPQEKVIQTVKEQIKDSLPSRLPKQMPLSSEKMHLSAATSSESDRYRVIFFESEKVIAVNDKQLNDSSIAKPIAVIEAHQYKSGQEAKSQVGYIPPEDIQTGNPPVDLGHSIKGYGDAGAGNKWLNWHEGRWYLQVHASNIEGNSDYVPLAKQMVSYLESNRLPVPHEYGSVKADVDPEKAKNNRVSWQEGKIVYTVSGVSDPIDMLAIACHLDKTDE